MSEYNQNVHGYMHDDGLGEKEAKFKATKTDIIVADDIDDNINGMYDSAMQRIVLNANNESALYYTVFHESVGEVLQAYNAAEDVAAMAEKRASKVRKMILDELDVAIENAQNATVDEKAKSSAAYSVGDYFWDKNPIRMMQRTMSLYRMMAELSQWRTKFSLLAI